MALMCLSRTLARPTGGNMHGRLQGPSFPNNADMADETIQRGGGSNPQSGTGSIAEFVYCDPTESQKKELREDNLRDNPLYALSERAELMTLKRYNSTRPPNTDEGEQICKEIESALNSSIALNINSTPCPWRYKCDYMENRYPHYFIRVDCSLRQRCSHSRCTATGNCVGMRGGFMHSHTLVGDCSADGSSSAWQTAPISDVYVGCKCES